MKKILFITNHSDNAVNSVVAWLDKLNQYYIRINTEDFFAASEKLTITLSNLSIDCNYTLNEIEILPSEILSVCYRRPSLTTFDGKSHSEYIHAQWKHAIWSLTTTLESYWVNHPLWGKNLLEHNKLYQLRLASTVGLKIPDTIISNNINEIVNFSRNHGDKVACKPLRHTNLVNEADAPVGIYTQMVTTKEFIGRDQSLSIAPMIIQQYIEKKIELRVTIIGHHVFACEIHSQSSDRTKHDWRRYDFENVKHAVHEIPRKISDRILKLMRALRLNYGAMDLIINPEGEYVFLEVNPTGQYGWIEDITGLPISKTFALALIEPTENGIKRYSVQ